MMGHVLGALVFLVSMVAAYLVAESLRRTARRRREEARRERAVQVDAAWRRWCESAGRAVDSGLPAPPWREPQ